MKHYLKSAKYSGPVNLLPLALCCSLGIHAAVFLLLKINTKTTETEISKTISTKPFSLINIDVLEPEIKLEPKKIEAPVQKAAPDDFVPADSIIEEIIAEQFTGVEKMETENNPPQNADTVQTTARSISNQPPENAELGTAYINRNFTYIQRRIRDKLVYPAPAKKAGIQGTAEVSFSINLDGTVSNLQIRKSAGAEMLDKAAMEAVIKAAPFRPPSSPVKIVIPIVFSIR
jgi:protein TonB